MIIITINLLQVIVDIGKYYSNHFTVAEIGSAIFNAMASLLLHKLIPIVSQLTNQIK